MVGSLSVLACACRSDGNMETGDGDDADYSCENPTSTEPAESESVVVVEEEEGAPTVSAPALQEPALNPPATESKEASAAPAALQQPETPSSVALTPSPTGSETPQK